jgi:hypothetical protein
MRPHEMAATQAVERLEAFRRESRNAALAREALGTWRRQIAATLLALAKKLEPSIGNQREARTA